ncbi:MAG: MarR family transcriptional regulator [Pseudomonadota bacterium]|nr:MarR family transcriptional regulator [Pseudomonadota bacterium]
MSRSPIPAGFYSADGYCANDSVGFLMRRVLLALTQDTDKRLEPHGLTHAQWGPLLMMSKSGSATVAELARELQMDPGAMTRLLDRLEAKGLCQRVRSTDDRRVVNLALTAEGREAAAKIPVALAEVMNAHLAGFSKTEWQALKGLLRRMLDNAESCRGARCAGAPSAETDTDLKKNHETGNDVDGH